MLATGRAGEIPIAKVDTAENPEWAMQFGVQSIPIMLCVHHGRLHNQQVGAMPEPVMRELVDDLLTAEHITPMH